jgi:hypothetical protein
MIKFSSNKIEHNKDLRADEDFDLPVEVRAKVGRK